jgi:hypothetical protein
VNLERVIERDSRCIGGHVQSTLEDYLEAVDDRHDGYKDSIHQLVTVTHNCGNVMQ